MYNVEGLRGPFYKGVRESARGCVVGMMRLFQPAIVLPSLGERGGLSSFVLQRPTSSLGVARGRRI